MSDGSSTYLYGLDRIARQNVVGRQYYLGDALGSVRQLTDPVSSVTLVRSYEPFGSVLNSAGDSLTPYGYTGEWSDPTNLIYLRARNYDPATGRFLSKDPVSGLISLPQTLNPYTYAANNPLRYTDPSGEYVESPLDVAFIIFDLASIGLDFYNLYYAAECEKGIIGQQLSIDISALLLDVVFLALPGATGGGLGLRLAFAGGGHLTLAGGVAAWRSLQWGYKGAQAAERVLYYFSSGRHKGFINNLQTMKDSHLRKTIRNLERRIEEHLDKIATNPTSRDVNHWQRELKTFRKELDLAIQEAIRRGIR